MRNDFEECGLAIIYLFINHLLIIYLFISEIQSIFDNYFIFYVITITQNYANIK